jgi:LysR family cys regulon transcriptional activator
VVQAFMLKFPKVRLSLLQGNPQQIAEMVQRDQADLAIATESIAGISGLITLPCYQWEHVVVVAPDHPLLKSRQVTLEEIAAFPIITYDSAFAGRSKIDHAFSLRGLKLDVLLEAIDADVIKTYVELGMGIGIIAGMAFDSERDKNLRAIPVGHLFGMNVSRVAVKQGAYLRSYIYTFIELLAPTLNRKLIEQAMSGEKEHYEL